MRISRLLIVLFLPAIMILNSCKEDEVVTTEHLVKINLKNANQELVFNQTSTPMNVREYEWTVKFDIDGNSDTGDFEGFDVAVSLLHFKFSETEVTGNILSNVQINTWILDGFGGTLGHITTADLDITDNSLNIVLLKEWEEIIGLDNGDRYKGVASYYTPNGVITDETSNGSVPETITDSENDVPYDFIDILSIMISQR